MGAVLILVEPYESQTHSPVPPIDLCITGPVGERIVLGQVLIEDTVKAQQSRPPTGASKAWAWRGDGTSSTPAICKKTVAGVMAAGSDLRVPLKGNYPKRLAAVRGVCRTPSLAEQVHPTGLGRRNRIEQRTARVWPLPETIGTAPWRRHFKTVVEGRWRVKGFNPGRRRFEPRKDPVAYSLVTRAASAETLAQAIRGHWGIETACTLPSTSPLARMPAGSVESPVSLPSCATSP